MKNHGGFYKHSIPKLNLSIERNTSQVPNDGKFHIVYDGCIVASFSSIKKAEERFRQLVQESGYKPEAPPTRPISARHESIERYLDAKDEYWAQSYKYRGKGGKGGRGGIP
ncbi:MAG TPA: hypothetical protein G4O03_06350 [Dehalococcoidia bacterium]|nr:hypothetical protein [Dehalococcoidia bacterium]